MPNMAHLVAIVSALVESNPDVGLKQLVKLVKEDNPAMGTTQVREALAELLRRSEQVSEYSEGVPLVVREPPLARKLFPEAAEQAVEGPRRVCSVCSVRGPEQTLLPQTEQTERAGPADSVDSGGDSEDSDEDEDSGYFVKFSRDDSEGTDESFFSESDEGFPDLPAPGDGPGAATEVVTSIAAPRLRAEASAGVRKEEDLTVQDEAKVPVSVSKSVPARNEELCEYYNVVPSTTTRQLHEEASAGVREEEPGLKEPGLKETGGGGRRRQATERLAMPEPGKM